MCCIDFLSLITTPIVLVVYQLPVEWLVYDIDPICFGLWIWFRSVILAI